MSTQGRFCSLIPGLGVKLSANILAGPTVLSAVGACPPHDGVRRRWLNVENAVAPSSARKKSDDLTTAVVPAGTSFPPCRGNLVISPYTRYAATFFVDQLNSVLSVHIRCRMTASLRATATAVGLLHVTSAEGFEDHLRAFNRDLKETGYVEGENVAIIYPYADSQVGRLPELAADLVRRKVAVIVSFGGFRSVSAAKAATTTIPIVSTWATVMALVTQFPEVDPSPASARYALIAGPNFKS